MRRWSGIGASPGIAVGPAFPLAIRITVHERRIGLEDVAAEISRFARALADADGQLARLQRKLVERNRGIGQDVVGAHRLMLKSPELAAEIPRLIAAEHVGAESALQRTLNVLRTTFAALDDPYFRERGSDVQAVGDRVLRALLGLPEARPAEGAPSGSIVVGGELSPLDPLQLKRAGIAGIATDSGGKTSHAAILARALGLPYVAALSSFSENVHPGDVLIVDGSRGEIIHNPDPDACRAYEIRAAADVARQARLASLRSLPAVTTDGVEVHLSANVECLPEIDVAIEVGAESIGLFRTEFLYLERATLPTEEEQYLDAAAVVRALAGRPVSFRTLDLGGDKVPASIAPPHGANPALGVRSIRLSLARPDIFRAQLRALYRASALGPVRILLPLVSGVTELARVRAICREVCAELAAEGQAHEPDTPIGAMIETPSAAWTVDHLARECDFFSIGTNDLIQYAFAADRDNEEVAHLYHPLHPAILRSLRAILEAARASRRPVSLCGDMAGDPALAPILLGLGLRDLSMTPRQIPLVKSVVRACALRESEELLARALALDSEVEVERLVLGFIADRCGADHELLSEIAPAGVQ